MPINHPKFLWVTGGCLAFLLIYLALHERGYTPQFKGVPSLHTSWEYEPERDERNLGLSEDQCQKAFPGQYVEIERARDWHKAHGGITRDKIKLLIDEPDKAHGQVKILIYNGNLYVVGEKQGVVDRTRYLHGLGMIYRAIVAIPDPRVIPNVEFTLDRMDHPNNEPHRPGRTAWGWCRHKNDSDTWVMPDFNGWATAQWEEVGGYRAFRERSGRFNTPFKDKIPKAIWRGQINVGHKVSEIRTKLIEQTKDKSWSDVHEIHWSEPEKYTVPMDEHCKWQFAFHTEGNSWSGRLRPLKNCNSVTIIHNPLEYIAHFYPLLKADGPQQNYVATKNDWSDLNEKMEYYLNHQDEAERIAQESIRTFRDRYLTPAAEACYIRRMIYEWAKVQTFEPELYKNKTTKDGMKEEMRGYSWEKFAWKPPAPFAIPAPPDDYFFKSNQIDFED